MKAGTTIIGENVIPSVGANYTDHATVLAVQKALTAKGFAPKKGNDGVWGPDTAETLKSWQYETGQPVSSGIDYGVLMALGVPSPSAAGVAASMSAASTLADATARAHAVTPSDAEIAQKAAVQAQAQAAAEAAVNAAKAKVLTAPTPQAAASAKQQLVVAEQRLAVVSADSPSFLMRLVPGLNRPVWQVGLGVLGVTAVTVGLYSLLSRQK